MERKPYIPDTIAGLVAPSILDLIKSAVPNAIEGTLKLMESVQRSFGNSATLEDCQRAVFRMIACDDNSSVFHSGTAFLVSAKGHVVTSCSIVHECTKFAVAVRHSDTGKPAWLTAVPIVVDPPNNLAVFFVIQENFVFPAPLGISPTPPKVLDDVVAVGFPCMSSAFINEGGLDVNRDENFTPCVTMGSISKVVESRIEHGATIATGNNGGPLVSLKTGEVIGVNTNVTQDDGHDYSSAVPAQCIIDLFEGRSGMRYKEYLALCAQSRKRPLNIQENLEECQRAVLRIYSEKCTGTAFLISKAGHIITNCHVIEDGEQFAVPMAHPQTGKITYLPAIPLRVDPSDNRDLAVLQLSNVDFPLPTPLPISQTPAQVSDDIVALGFASVSDEMLNSKGKGMNTIEYLTPSVTKGSISKITQSRIEHGATIAHGNSGGPLVSQETGEVLGVNTNVIQDDGHDFSYAVPAQYIFELLERKSGMNYEEYHTRYPMDDRAAKIILCHLDFLTAKAFGIDTKEIYADKLTDKSKNSNMTRVQFENAIIKLSKDWPIRAYRILSIKRSGDTLETLCKYGRKSWKGVEEDGYAMFTLVLRGRQITEFSEKHSDKPIKHTNRFKEIVCDYYRNRIFRTN